MKRVRRGGFRGLAVRLVPALALVSLGAAEQARADEATVIRIDGSTTVGPIAKAFAEYYEKAHPEVNITVGESGSGNGAKRLKNKECDIATLSRFLTDSEVSASLEAGICPVAHVIALDRICIIVHPSNPVDGLTMDQVRDIYSGKVNNWKELGGPDREIIRISRDTNSGTFATVQAVVMRGERMDPGTEKVGSNGHAHQRVKSTPGAIGYVSLGFVDRDVKALTINGVDPTSRRIAPSEYRISRPLFMFTNGYPELGTHLHQFVTLYLTREGQEIIESLHFIPLTDYRTRRGR